MRMQMENRYLFRGKRKDNREWVFGHYYEFMGKHYIFESPFTSRNLVYEIDLTTICRYTGLDDKNGKQIWERDIVDGHIKRGAAFITCLVLWNESKARFDVRAKGCNFPMTLDEVAGDISVGGLDYEVVGNQFDNPDLLELLEL